MNSYTFSFSGEITVEAETEEEAEARDLVDELVAPTPYAYDNCENISIYELELIEVLTEIEE